MAACGVCGGIGFAPFFRSSEWSCTGRYLKQPEPAGEPIAILLEYCRNCGLIRQEPDHTVELDYTGIERDTEKQLPDYAARIIASLTGHGVAAGDLVVEVGANDGTFLKALRDAGFRNLLGVEPSKRLAALGRAAGLNIHGDYFSPDAAAEIVAAHGKARAVISRHTLEHVPDIRAMAEGFASLLAPGGVCFVEVPDSDWIVSDLFTHEVWDEHITYFRASSLAGLMDAQGLTPMRMERVRFRDTCNLLCWCVPGAPRAAIADTTGMDDLADFQTRWDAFAARLRSAVAAAPRPLIAIGASHIQLNFLNFTGLSDAVGLMIDDDPVKAGHYAPLAVPVPIRTTADVLSDVRGGTLLRTAFPYPAWQDRLEAGLTPHGVRVIDPYSLR